MNNNIITIEKYESVKNLSNALKFAIINNIEISVLQKMINQVEAIKEADTINRMRFFNWFYKLNHQKQVKLISKVIIKNQTAFYFDGLQFRSIETFKPLLVGEEIKMQDFKNISIEEFQKLPKCEKIGRWGAFYEI